MTAGQKPSRFIAGFLAYAGKYHDFGQNAARANCINCWKVNRNTMFIVGYLFEALGYVIAMVLNIYMWIIIARAVLSWVNPDPYNPIVRFLYSATEPVLGALRRRVPLFFGGIDFAPLVVILAIVFLERFLVPTLFALARQFGGG